MKMTKFLLCLILFLLLGIICKSNAYYKEYIYDKLYNDTISFKVIEKIYNKYFGSVFPIDFNEYDDTLQVSSVPISYTNIEKYGNGVRLEVGDNYLVQSQVDGVVVYSGDKGIYKSVIILEDSMGIEHWYGNICNYSVELYDHIKEGEILGETCDNSVYLVYTRGDTFLDYDSYME